MTDKEREEMQRLLKRVSQLETELQLQRMESQLYQEEASRLRWQNSK